MRNGAMQYAERDQQLSYTSDLNNDQHKMKMHTPKSFTLNIESKHASNLGIFHIFINGNIIEHCTCNT